MNLDDLQKNWAAYDAKLDAVLKLNQRAVREAGFARVKKSLFWHKVFIVGEILVGAWFVMMLGSFTANHWGEWKYVVPSVLLHIWVVVSIGFVTYELIALNNIDYGQPIMNIQKSLEERRISRIRFTKWLLLSGTVLWVLWLVVGLKGIFGLDAYAGGGTRFIAINLIVGGLAAAVFLVVSRLNADRIRRSAVLRKIADSFAGDSLLAASAHLDELSQYETGSEAEAAPRAPANSQPAATSRIPLPIRMLKIVAISAVTVAAILLGAGLALTHATDPEFKQKPAAPAQPSVRPDGGNCYESGAARCLVMRDGLKLGAVRYEGKNNATIVLTHGLLTDGRSLESTASELRDTTGAEVWTLDLRGHGRSGGRPGDIDYVGQYEHDLADAVAHIRKARPEGKLVLGGHAVGGGMAVRYAQLRDAPRVDGYLLYTPHLGHTSPTNQSKALEAAKTAAEPFIKIHEQRILGLLMLNTLGIHAYDDLPTLFFNRPAGSWIDRYSFRAMRNIGPEDYRAALRADDKPMLVLVGSKDTISAPGAFAEAIALHKNGKSIVIEGAKFDDIATDKRSLAEVKAWMTESGLVQGSAQ
jgi:alpha-beta hydrolase superfamily lysophospholipase